MAAKVMIALALLATAALGATRQEKIDAGMRQISTSPKVSAWMTEEEVFNLIRNNVGFMDITDRSPSRARVNKAKRMEIPSAPSYQAEVRALIPLLNTDNIYDDLNVFSSFNNRYYNVQSGAESSAWLFEYVQSIASNSSLRITVEQFEHTFLQSSVVAVIPGSISSERVIIGAHQDSINSAQPQNGRAPGADDDGSGSMTVLEIFRTFVLSGHVPELTIEFHWYAAEEVGLRGSQAIADSYADAGVSVRSMLQLDMVGFPNADRSIGLVTDYTSAELNVFIRALINEYLNIGFTNSVCGYGCSDHASWDDVGYDAAFPFEAPFGEHNALIHTAQDTISRIDFEHVYEFAKLGLSFVIELSHAD